MNNTEKQPATDAYVFAYQAARRLELIQDLAREARITEYDLISYLNDSSLVTHQIATDIFKSLKNKGLLHDSDTITTLFPSFSKQTTVQENLKIVPGSLASIWVDWIDSDDDSLTIEILIESILNQNGNKRTSASYTMERECLSAIYAKRSTDPQARRFTLENPKFFN